MVRRTLCLVRRRRRREAAGGPAAEDRASLRGARPGREAALRALPERRARRAQPAVPRHRLLPLLRLPRACHRVRRPAE